MNEPVTVGDVIYRLEEAAPLHLAEPWDAPGLALGNRQSKVDTVLLALDLTTEAVERACAEEASLIITHHPPLFGAVRSLTEDTRTGKLVTACIRQGISVYAAHTNLDAAVGGVGYALAFRLFDQDGFAPLAVTGEQYGVAAGFGRLIGIDRTPAADLLVHVRERLSAPEAKLYGYKDREHCQVAVWPGSFDDAAYDLLLQSGATLLVVGEMKHHMTVALPEDGVDVIVTGHGESESIVLPNLASLLQDTFPTLRLVLLPYRTIQ